MARRHCKHGTCEWLPIKGSYREICAVCRDKFPCGACQHLDCIERRIESGVAVKRDFDTRNNWMAKFPIKGLPVPTEQELLVAGANFDDPEPPVHPGDAGTSNDQGEEPDQEADPG